MYHASEQFINKDGPGRTGTKQNECMLIFEFNKMAAIFICSIKLAL